MYSCYLPFRTNSGILLLSGAISAIVLGIIAANSMGKDVAILFGNFVYLPVGGFLILVSVWATKHFGIDGIHGMAWIAFAGFAISWGIADNIWTAEELFFEIEPYPSLSDVFYLTGYPFLAGFLVLFLLPFRRFITKRMVLYCTVLSVGVIAVSLYPSINQTNLSDDDYVSILYPISDGVILVPTFLGIRLFLQDKNRTRQMWVLVFFGILASFAGDVLFVTLIGEEQYFTGHYMEMLFLSAYALMAFGVYDYAKSNFMRTR